MIESVPITWPSLASFLEDAIEEKLREEGDCLKEYAAAIGLEPRELVLAAFEQWLLAIMNPSGSNLEPPIAPENPS